MTIEKLINKWLNHIKKISQSPYLDLEILLSFVLKKDRTYLKAYPEKELLNEQVLQFESLLERRLQGEPIAYIIQKQPFWDFELYVDQNVLIPRGDSEILVEAVLDMYDKSKEKTLIDLGCGSGALAIAIAKERPNWHVFASDRSIGALNITKKNIHEIKLNNVYPFLSDWFNAIRKIKAFDIIISNPPYIDPLDESIESNVSKYEPHQALFSKDNGLNDINIIIEKSKSYLKKRGMVFLEHGYQQGNKVRQKFIDEKFCHVKTFSDLSGHQRVTFATTP